MSMTAFLTGNLLVQETTGSVTHVPIPIDATLTGQETYFHAQVSVAAGAQNQSVALTLAKATVVYIKSKKESDGSAKKVIVEFDGYSGSVSTGEVNASEICIFNTDVVAIKLSNDGPDDILVEIACVGE